MKKWLILVSVMFLLSSVAGCQPTTPAKSIPIGIIGDLSGPSSSVAGIAYGVRDYLIYYNEKYGGINGYPIDYRLVDGEMDMAKEIAAYKELMTSLKPVSIHLWSTGMTRALRRDVNEVDKIPVVAATTEIVDPVNLPFNFVTGPSHTDMLIVTFDWMRELGGRSVVILGANLDWNITPIKGVVEELKYPAKIGLEVLDWIQYPAKPTDVTVEMLRARKLNPDFYFVWDTPEGSIPCLRAASELGIPSDKFLVGYWAMYPVVIETVGAEGCEGVKSFRVMMSVDELIEEGLPVGLEIEEFSSTHKLYTRSWDYVKGWTNSRLMVEAISRAIGKNDNVVPEDIYQFRQLVRDEWEAIKGWNIGIGVGSVDYSDHKGWTSMTPMICRNGVWEVYGPAREIKK